MRNRVSIFIFVLFLMGSHQKMYSQNSFDESKIEIVGEVSIVKKNSLQIDFKLQNTSGYAIYFAGNPTQVDGKCGYYIKIDEANNSTIQIESRVYPPSIYSPYSNETRVELIKLDNEQVFNGTVLLNLPLKETIPPKDDPYKIKTIVLENIKGIKFNIGYFFEEKGILNFLKTKPQGWFIKGHENIFSGDYAGKKFYEIQKQVSFNISLNNFKNTK